MCIFANGNSKIHNHEIYRYSDNYHQFCRSACHLSFRHENDERRLTESKNKRRDAVHFSDHLNANLSQMNSAVENALLIMDSNLSDYDHADFASAHEAENAVNSLRDRLRVEHINALKTMKYDYAIGNAYSSLYAQYEKLADHIINVTEALQ